MSNKDGKGTITKERDIPYKTEKKNRLPKVERMISDYLVKQGDNGYHGYSSLAAAIQAGYLKTPSYVDSLGAKFEESLSENSLWTFKKKYSWRKGEGEIVESPRQAVYRMARTMAEVEGKYKSSEKKIEEFTREFAEAIYERRFCPAGRVWTNAGTEVKGLFNCYVLPVADSMEGIFESVKNAAIIHKNGGGTGYNFSELRPRGTYVKKSKGVASGPVSFISVFDVETAVTNSGNRRGANMGILDIDHPDILGFIYAKGVKRQITNFNVSVGATDEFMKAVDNNDFYTLSYMGKDFTAGDLKYIIKNISDGKLGGSEVGQKPEPPSLTLAENGKDVIDSYSGKIAGRVKEGVIQLNAKYVFDTICRLAWKTGDPGMIFLDAINKYNPLPQLGDIKATNPCVTGDTLITTEFGLMRMRELVEKYPYGGIKILTDHRIPIKIMNFDGTIMLIEQNQRDINFRGISCAFYSGIKPAFRLLTKSGYELEATADHKIFTTNGKKRLIDIRPGEDRVLIQCKEGSFNKRTELPFDVENDFVGKNGKKYKHNLPKRWSKELGQILGWLIGDGWIRDQDKNCRLGFTFGENDKEILDYLKPIINSFYGRDIKEVKRNDKVFHLSYHSKYFVEFFKKLGIKIAKADKKEVPRAIFTAPKEAIVGFLQGLFSSDGTLRNSKKSSSDWIALTSKSLELLKQVQILLGNLGIKSRIFNRSRKPRDHLFKYKNKKNETKFYGSDGVLYELGVFGSNIEIFKKEIGFISRMNQNKLDKFRFKNRRKTLFVDKVVSIEYVGEKEVYDLTEPTTHSMICNSIVVTQCGEQPLHPYDACNLGSINLEVMVKQNNGKAVIDYEKIRKTCYSTIRFMDNVNDANEGPIPEVGETVLKHRRIGLGVMGWADMLTQLGVAYDSEEALKLAGIVMGFITDEAKKMSCKLAKEKEVFPEFKGSRYDTGKLEDRVRNAERTTIAPTGTISMLYEVGSGIEPFYAVGYIKKIRGGDTLYYFNKLFEKMAKEKGFWNEELKEKIVENRGSLKGITEIPEEIQRIFPTAFDVTPEWHVKMQAAFQRYTDNAVSKTINLPNEAKVEDIAKSYFDSWKLGCKGITVYRDGSLEVQVLETGVGKDKKVEPIIKRHRDDDKPIKLPKVMPSLRIRQETPFGNIHGFVVFDPSDYRPYEFFGLLGKGGDTTHADIEALGRLVSIFLREGRNLDEITEQLEGIGSGVGVFSSEGKITSIPDGLSMILKKWQLLVESGSIPGLINGTIDLYDVSDRMADQLRKGKGNGKDAKKKKDVSYTNSLKCEACGKGPLVMIEGCKVCLSCDTSRCE